LATDEDQIDLRGDGRIVLYKRQGLKNPKWQVRVRVPNANGYKIVSTKTDNKREAERFALDLYEDLYIHVKGGGTINSKTFKQVFDEWEKATKTLSPTRQGGSWDATVARLRTTALPYFGSKRIDSLNSSTFNEYWMWRKTNYTKKPPTNGTLRREYTCLRPLLRFAYTKGYISKIPDIEPPKAKAERRATFTLAEWQKIYKASKKWLEEGEDLATWRDRFVAWQSFLILANTGMRVGELRNLRWKDLRTVKTDMGKRLIAYVRGKTGARECVFQPGAEDYIKRLYDLRVEELIQEKKQQEKAAKKEAKIEKKPIKKTKPEKVDEKDPKPDPDEFVTVHKNGKPVITMKRSFYALLKFAKVPEEYHGSRRTIYSLRHFYATQRLSHETSPFLLAKQMGTSVEMLEKFYGHTVTSALAAEVSKSNRQRSSTDNKKYPFE
jgi:integrase